MGSTWNHPGLGGFEFGDFGWTTTVRLPAFDAFTYKFSGEPPSTTGYELSLEVKGEDEWPSPEAVALAEKVVANQARLAPAIVEALWDDFNGRGPHSGMGWRGDLAGILDWLEGTHPLAASDDLPALMRLTRIVVRESVCEYEAPVVDLWFEALFEDEHGVSVLTDGEGVLGFGYMGEASPFVEHRR